jgi:Major Facilitator Superfamily.
MAVWLKSAALYREPRILGILFLGFSSGLPFLLTLATLHVWLSEIGISKTIIGLFAFVTIPYSLKFIWAPLIDRFPFPLLSTWLGHRKGWMLASQIMLVIMLILLGSSNPEKHVWYTAACALLVSFFSATQDIVIEAYRVERLEIHEIGPGAGASNLGYRLGMWVSGAGALYLASKFSWAVTYSFMAACLSIGMIATLLSHEPTVKRQLHNLNEKLQHHRLSSTTILKVLWQSLKDSTQYFAAQHDWPVLLAYILFFKLADTALNVMAAPFLLEVGFSKLEIAHVGKAFGIGAMIVGGLFAGILLAQCSLRKVLLLCAGMQLASAIMFYLQALVGYNITLLFATIGIENLSNGMGAAAFITYLSIVCRGPHAGAHFALLTSIASLARVSFSSLSGWTADHLGWPHYYILTAIVCLPNLVLMLRASRAFKMTPSPAGA